MAKVSLRAYNREIETMIDRGQLDEAIAHCHHILKVFPKHLDTYRLLGKAYLESKRYGDAADIFLRILASVPNDFVAQVGMSIIRDEENKLDDAIWHMERAFETQPSNPAIQSELQRLYGRRDGVQPPRIRMTRGALANMYVQGELYPQAISEIRSVLKDDPQRADMQALLARASFRSGQKNEAADVASALLRRYPYSLDANRVLAEILGAERPENAQLYRQRVVELDPYASQVTGTMFQSNEVPEAAIGIERLDWNGQPVSMQPDWGEARAISLESGTERNVQPDWMQGPFGDVNPAPQTPSSMFESSTPAPAQPGEEIPDFLRAAGWGESTGAFDESKSVFAADESTSEAQPLAQGDLPDWVKAMKPAETEPAAEQSEQELPDWIKAMKPQDSAPAAQESEEELPDWINNIGTGALSSQPSQETDWLGESQQSIPAPASDQPDWLNQPASTPAEEQSDWMSQLSQQEQTIPLPTEDQPDWMKELSSETESVSPTPADDLDWLKGLAGEPDTTPQPAQTETPDWLKELGSESEVTPAEQQLETPVAESSSGDFDFLNPLTEEPVLNTPESTPSAAELDKLGVTDQERDDSFAWLESLAAKQGASEGLLTKPEDRLEEEPEWVKQAKGLRSTPPSVPEPTASPAAGVEDLGKSEQEQEDSFAWLENLAAKQGATEGLLTKPEERHEEEPDWVKQAKGLGTQEPAAPVATEAEPAMEAEQPAPVDEVEEWLQNLEGHTASEPEPAADETATWLKSLEDTQPSKPVSVPSAGLEELGKSEQEQDDSFAWLENLAARQGATEGLLMKPEERREEEPDWVKQAKDLSAPEELTTPVAPEPAPETPAAMDDTGIWLRSLETEEKSPEPTPDETAVWLQNLEEQEKTSQPAAAADDTAMWLKGLEEGKLPEAEPAADETAMWLKSLDQEEAPPAQVEASTDALPDWLQNIEQEETPVADAMLLEQETRIESISETPAEEPVNTEEFKLEEENIPNWLADLDKEEETSVSVPADDDLPAWLRADETAPAAAEPTRPTDWQPVEEKAEETQPEIIYSPPLEEPEQPQIVYSPPLEETPEPVAQEESFQLPEELRVEPLREEPAPETVEIRETTPSYQEPVARRVPGVIVPSVDPVLGMARNELSRNNVNSALESYARLIKRGRFLDEVIYDLRDALYRYPVDVNVWQSLGDAYMRANRLQDALDAYTKAEELLR